MLDPYRGSRDGPASPSDGTVRCVARDAPRDAEADPPATRAFSDRVRSSEIGSRGTSERSDFRSAVPRAAPDACGHACGCARLEQVLLSLSGTKLMTSVGGDSSETYHL